MRTCAYENAAHRAASLSTGTHARALPWQRRHAAARVWPAVIAPAAVVVDFIVFHGLVDWP
ncbi:hypothetical protein [Streptomyces sp. WM6373]|uniref:hypothetical protein n=1 Tax=Streptomyces sp. WM6373 TaxID=1415556 RepID=UPI000AD95D99|nr:hypothetical protein [Streptomyces sp. WM6373]